MLSDLKFTEAELAGNDISSLPDRPGDAGITAAELKARFDKIPKMMVALGNFNTLIDSLTAGTGAGEIGAAPAEGIEGGTVQAQLYSMSGKTAEAVKAAETAAEQGTAATQAAEAATQTAAEAAAAAQAATDAAQTAAAQGEEAAAAAVLATNTVTEVKAYAEQQAQSAKDYVDEVILQAGTVASVFGRAGDITAQFGDYTAEQVSMAGYDSAAAAITEAIVLANTAGSAAEAAQSTADAAKAVTDTAGLANGLATLNENGKLKQMPNIADVGGSNENLLHNWHFADPINQRGQTEYSGGAKYTIDRWKSSSARGIITLESGALKITSTAESDNYAYLHQPLENGVQYYGAPLTFTVLDADNGLHCLTATLTAAEQFETLETPFGTLDIGSITTFGDLYVSIGVNQGGNSKSFVAAKLELGTQQTLAHQDADGNWVLNDPPPDKALELAKCQRYQIELNMYQNKWTYIGIGILRASSTTGFAVIPLPVTLRAKPAVLYSGKWCFSPKVTTATVIPITSISIDQVGANAISIKFTVDAVQSNDAMVGMVEPHNDTTASLLLDANL